MGTQAVTIIVFSKDRAMQLHTFLRSFAAYVRPRVEVFVLYYPSSVRHRDAYDDVFADCLPDFMPIEQTSFKDDLLGLLPMSGSVLFFVDDQIFVRPWDVISVPGLSLRLAPHLTHCYPIRTEQPVPLLRPSSMPPLLEWQWDYGVGDWGYPLSLDGHIFDAAEIRRLITMCEFHSPNSLEEALQRFRPVFTDRYGYCYQASKVVNVPWNRVQTDCENRHGDVATVDGMLTWWEAGMQINLLPLCGVMNVSAHQEFPLPLEARPS